MLRPHFPAFFRERELPDVNLISEVIVAVTDVWRVGDLADWFSDGCFWSGTITEIMDDDMVQVISPVHIFHLCILFWLLCNFYDNDGVLSMPMVNSRKVKDIPSEYLLSKLYCTSEHVSRFTSRILELLSFF